jgi:hypothetical protein
MYTRVPPACDDASGRAAYELWQDAAAAEAAGDAMAAMQLYRRCARTCATFAELMGIA